jgi:CheY-like chemotaxis protein
MISGRECVAELKKIDRLADVPVIVYTTSSFDKDIEDLKKMGVNHYLVKPRSFSALATILKTLFTRKELPFLLTSEV